MTEATRLYGDDLSTWKASPYEEVLLRKLLLGNQLLERLVRGDNMVCHVRINDVVKATKFNRGLLYELGYSDPEIVRKMKDIT